MKRVLIVLITFTVIFFSCKDDSYINDSPSSGEFTPSYISLLSPKGGETWEMGTKKEITWWSYGVTNVQIDLTTDDGSSWTQIDIVSDQPKKYEWTVPELGSEEAKIKIINNDDPQVFNVSDRFVIKSPRDICTAPTITYGGKLYNTVKIGVQCWLRENLDVGTMIERNGNKFLQTNNGVIEKYCYDNDPTNCEKYGGLYQWPEAMQYRAIEGAQGICPQGWHIPTLSEFEELKAYVDNKAAALVDESDTLRYIPSVTKNGTGFSALFEGYLHVYGSFFALGYGTYLWSSSDAYGLNLFFNSREVHLNGPGDTMNGLSIRCIQD